MTAHTARATFFGPPQGGPTRAIDSTLGEPVATRTHTVATLMARNAQGNDMQAVRAHVFVRGRVQGVCFRAYTCETANALGVTGWVRNLHDGRVEAVFEGPRDRVEKAVEWCRHGPPAAMVVGVDLSWEAATGQFRGFTTKW